MHSGNDHGMCRLPMLLFLFAVSGQFMTSNIQPHTTHPPQLNESIVTRGNNQRKGRVDGHPIYTSIVTLQNEFDDCVRIPKHIRLIGVGTCHLLFKGHGGRCRVLLPQSRDVPNANGLIEGGGNDQVFLGVELSAHHIMVMTGHSTDCTC